MKSGILGLILLGAMTSIAEANYPLPVVVSPRIIDPEVDDRAVAVRMWDQIVTQVEWQEDLVCSAARSIPRWFRTRVRVKRDSSHQLIYVQLDFSRQPDLCESNPDPWFQRWVMSPKANSIERNLGIAGPDEQRRFAGSARVEEPSQIQ